MVETFVYLQIYGEDPYKYYFWLSLSKCLEMVFGPCLFHNELHFTLLH